VKHSRSLRYPAAALMAGAVTLGLFFLMQTLVGSDRRFRLQLEPLDGIRFGPVEIPDELTARSRVKPKKPPPPDNAPPPPRLTLSRAEQPSPDMPAVEMPRLNLPLVGAGGLYLGTFDQPDPEAEGDVIPIVVIRPMYPREAAITGTEGWVKVEFIISETGDVKNPRVVDAEPARIFNREAIRAILKWKFKPRVIDGVAVERRATQTIDFTLQDSEAR